MQIGNIDQEEQRGRCPRAPAGEGSPSPDPGCGRSLRDLSKKQLAAVSWIGYATAPGQASFAGRLCAKRTVNKGIFPEKQTSLFFWENVLVLYARELACPHRPNRRKQVWFTLRASSPGWVQGFRAPGKSSLGMIILAFGQRKRTARNGPEGPGLKRALWRRF